MDLCYDDVQLAYRDEVRRFADRVLAPFARSRFDFTRPITREEMQTMAHEIERHEIATSPPLTEDGSLDLINLGIFIEEVSRIDIAFASLANALFFQVWNMESLMNAEQRLLYGHMFGRGEMVSIGISEPEAGSRPSEMRTTARRTADGWRLDGQKLWTSHAQVAAGLLLACRKIEADGADAGISLFMVDPRHSECAIRPVECIGMNATATCEVFLNNCLVPLEAEFTPGANGLKSALKLVEQARIKIVFMAVGVARASLELAVGYSKQRQQLGRPIASFQLVQEMLTEMSTLVETSRLLGYRAASLMMAAQPARAEISMAKAYATEAAARTTSLGIQVHGGIGLTTGYSAERLFRDARMLTIPDGTTEVHKLVVGRDLTGISAFAS